MESGSFAVILLLTVSFANTVTVQAGCDKIIAQDSPEFRNSNFSYIVSPNFPQPYPSGISCVYTFIARPRHRVRLQFEYFNLTKNGSECGDYMDIYSDVKTLPDLARGIDDNLTGRYCGNDTMNVLRISLHQIMVLVFHVRKDSAGAKGFSIRCDFINESRYLAFGAGRPYPGESCGLDLRGETGRMYHVVSPTFPAVYPPDLKCKYLLRAERANSTRIRLNIRHFDFYSDGEHCAYDALTIYDGDSNRAPIITRLCGWGLDYPKNIIHSFGNSLYMEFTTSRAPYRDRYGFLIEAEFSDRLVNTSQLAGPDPRLKHISGTECDFSLRSAGESHHVIQSPVNAGADSTICTFYLLGLDRNGTSERINLTFLNISASDHPSLHSTPDRRCRFQASISTGNYTFFDRICGNDSSVPDETFESEGPVMVVTSNLTKNASFMAKVVFFSDEPYTSSNATAGVDHGMVPLNITES